MALVQIVKRVALEERQLPSADPDMPFLVTSLNDFFAELAGIHVSEGCDIPPGQVTCPGGLAFSTSRNPYNPSTSHPFR
jgi:hypothetical protein